MIPAFGVLYVLMADDFYQTSAPHETSFLANKSLVEEATLGGIAQVVEDQADEDFGKFSGGGFQAGPISIDGSNFLITTYLSTSLSGEQPVEITIPQHDADYPEQRGGGLRLYYIISRAPVTSKPKGPADELGLFLEYSASDDRPYLRLRDPKAIDAFRQLASGANGQVSGLPRQFPRMLYFSAVTATTLGYGDIVPVATRARGLITVEAVLGVILVGLFLNSIAQTVTRGRNGGQAPLPDQPSLF
jgi:hypothetical protein